MNIHLSLDLPLINSKGDIKNYKTSGDLFLTPYYAIEEDVLPLFDLDVSSDKLPVIRSLLFNNSIKVYNLTTRLETIKLFSDKELFMLRRDYTICLTTNDLAKKYLAEASKEVNKKKSLGDFSVSIGVKNDVAGLYKKVFEDSSSCIADIMAMIAEAEADLIMPSLFVSGQYNPNNIQANDRLWWLKDLTRDNIVDGYASNKFWYNGNAYKSGTLNIKRGI